VSGQGFNFVLLKFICLNKKVAAIQNGSSKRTKPNKCGKGVVIEENSSARTAPIGKKQNIIVTMLFFTSLFI
jgi:hypothetical protein